MVNAHGPNAQQLYTSAGSEPQPSSYVTGGMGQKLSSGELSARQKYAEPAHFEPAALPEDSNAPNYYNYNTPFPVKYSQPSAAKERLQARHAIRENAKSSPGAVQRIDPISEEEVSYLQSMQSQAEIADFDRYVNSLLDPRKPGQLRILMELYPEFVNNRIQQAHTDYEFALRNQMIDQWGINTFDDLHFKYLVDQGKISGPKLTIPQPLSQSYTPGILSPHYWKSQRPKGIRLPFASAQYGQRPGRIEEWEMTDERNPMSKGRNIDQLAKGMYATSNLRNAERLLNTDVRD
ncbi:hypothetical protein [Pleurochrysis sp. endemic virus 2]|nr:hypothetical protein [Pleurochrysis sp. endemic virus 2]